ncbi:GNAT family N-acetyltransferase [Streptomyces sp. NPDC056069]|uniref:GNAT family N-acetyltransferase n=1 Tax=Streptomyces sp. NPDC056069 TaxID=3345702 RepID=UPI0035E38834
MSGNFKAGTVRSLSVRVFAPKDLPRALTLIAADQLPGEPPVHDLPPLPLSSPSTVFTLSDTPKSVRGVMCLSMHSGGSIGLIPWLHAGEDHDAIVTLLTFARRYLGPCALHAFTSPASAAGVPGLPMRHRRVTAHALATDGFTPAAVQSYLLRDLANQPAAPGDPIAEVVLLSDLSGWRLTVTDSSGSVIATAVVRRPSHGSGTAGLWYLDVDPDHRRHGIGHRLLTQCANLALTCGARRLAAYCDEHDEVLRRFFAAQQFNTVDSLAVQHRRN